MTEVDPSRPEPSRRGRHTSRRAPRAGRQTGHLHGHGHGHLAADRDPDAPIDPAVVATRRRATVLLVVTVLPLLVATIAGVVVLWPDGDGPQDRRLDTTYSSPGASFYSATVESVDAFACPGAEPSDPDQESGRGLTCVRAAAALAEGPNAGDTVTVDLPPETHRAGIASGDRIRLLHVGVGPERVDYYAFIDFEREIPMAVLAAIYAVLVVAVARMRGLRALLGLGFAYAALGTFMLPALLEGKPAGLVGLVGCSAIMFVALYLAHGLSARTTTALLGTLFGLALTALLAAWSTSAAKVTGMVSEDNFILLQATDNLDLSQIVLCGIIVAGLGVLNDVTITQASAVWELYELSPDRSARTLFTGAMRIGRDHIASTVYTIAFAYAGAALPVLLLITLYERPFLTAITSGELAEEVVRTLVGSVGLVLAIPATTAIAVLVVKAVGITRPAYRHTRLPRPATAAAVATETPPTSVTPAGSAVTTSTTSADPTDECPT